LSDSEAVAIVVQENLLPLVQAVRSEMPALRHVIVVDSSGQTSQTLSFSRLIPGTPKKWMS
jgi:hypothetical protein